MNRRPLLRSLLASAAIAAALALAGCDTETLGIPEGRALAPLSDKMLAEIEAKNMTKESPILVRLYKEESELEVWKQDNTGHFELLKTYPICRWSGELGPKVKEGDRQAPEGFYPITPGQMNPNSNYYLAINTGFPNAYDRANGRTGAFLMIHGDCSSSGCYAMTDEQIAEIYALARESIFGGQKSFQIQAYPFHMTAANMAKHRNSPNMAFWRMIKEGNDHFEVTHLEPKVDVCERHYVFDAQSPDGRPLHFDPTGKCPVYKQPEEMMSAVKEKQQRDETQFAELVGRNTDTVPVRTGMDGGMNPVFQAAVAMHGGTEQRIQSANGSIPANIRPPGPRDDLATGSTMSLASAESRPVAAPASSGGSSGNLFSNLFSSKGETASTSSSSESGGGMFDRMSRLMGLHGSEQPAGEASASSKSKPATAKPTQTASTNAAKPKPSPAAKSDPASDTKTATTPSQPANQQANAAAPAGNSGSTLSGAAATVPAGSFDSRWGGMH